VAYGRENLDWTEDHWQGIDQAVHDEMTADTVARKYIPVSIRDALTVPANVINRSSLTIDEGATKALVEIGVHFSLTSEQYRRDAELGTGSRVARAAARELALVEDKLILQGAKAFPRRPVGRAQQTLQIQGDFGLGLLDQAKPPSVPIPPAKAGPPKQYLTETFNGVTRGISQLVSRGFSGSYALELEFAIFADTHFTLNQTTSGTTADLIRPLVENRLYQGPLPANRGVLTSQAGNSMELIFGMDATTRFLQVDTDGNYLFEVTERLALTVSDPSAIVRLEFT
jgi:uncharacterized linocin/CFP29 family protein